MVLTALRGAIGFLTRLPVGTDERAWDAFTRQPATIPMVGYLIGAIVALPFLLPVPAPVVAMTYLLVLLAVTGITHLDGLGDLGDAMAVHGDAQERRAAMGDTNLGAGGVVALTVGIIGLTLAALAIAALPLRLALALVVLGEVAAKSAMTLVAFLGEPAHEGMGSAMTDISLVDITLVGLITVPAILITWPWVTVGLATVSAGVVISLLVYWWATSELGGVTGDVFGATNELTRLLSLHMGVVAWTLS